MKNGKRILVMSGSALSLMLLGGAITTGIGHLRQPSPTSQTTSTPTLTPAAIATPNPPPVSPQAPNFVVAVINRVGDAVVKIEVQRERPRQMSDRLSSKDFFRQFQEPESARPPQEGTGSGFIFRSEGYIMTNAHVVDGVDTVTVKLKDGRRFNGEIVGRDRLSDVAVIKIQAKDLPTVELGNSTPLQVGESAIAIGNPLGLDNTVTTGIISALGRSSADLGQSDFHMELIQTDAAINPGNSGGPLLNQNGQVVGMNTAIIQNAQGLGFAIPIHRAKRIASQLISQGKYEHPYLGIKMISSSEIPPQSQHQNDNDQTEGVVVINVINNSPADQAGFRLGDVIHKVNQQVINEAEDMQRFVSSQSIGDKLQLIISRENRKIQLTITVGALPKT